MTFATSLQSRFASPHPARCPAINWRSLSTITNRNLCVQSISLSSWSSVHLRSPCSQFNRESLICVESGLAGLSFTTSGPWTRVRWRNQALFDHDLWKLSLFHQSERITLERRYGWPTVRINARPFVWLFLRFLAHTSHKNDFNVLTVASQAFKLFPFGYDYWFPVRSRSGEISHHTCVERSINAWYLRSSAITMDWIFWFFDLLQQRHMSLFIHVSSSRSMNGNRLTPLTTLRTLSTNVVPPFMFICLSGCWKGASNMTGEPPSCRFCDSMQTSTSSRQL